MEDNMSKEAEMRAAWKRWRASGMSRSSFAREQGIPIHTFYYWCQRFEGKPPTAAERRKGATGAGRAGTVAKDRPPAFVEIATTESTTTPRSATTARRETPRMRFELPDGTAITIY